MVDITHCEVCGKTIPAIAQACPYCERQRPSRRTGERPYLPLAIRLLLYLFLADVAATMGMSIMTLLANRDGSILAGALLVAALLRFLLGGAVLGAFFFREPASRVLALAFLGLEALGVIGVLVGLVPIERWVGGLVAPLWNVLFVFLFLRADLRAYLDPGVADRQQLDLLVKSVERGERG